MPDTCSTVFRVIKFDIDVVSETIYNKIGPVLLTRILLQIYHMQKQNPWFNSPFS